MGIALIFLGVGAFCVLLFKFAVYALPAMIGIAAGFWAMNTGAGIGSPVIGLVAGVATFLLGQMVFAWSHSAWLRWAVILLFAGPSAIAGYGLAGALGELGAIPSPLWQSIFGVIAGAIVGATTIARLAAFPIPRPVLQRPAPPIQTRPRPTGLQQSMQLPEEPVVSAATPPASSTSTQRARSARRSELD